jgi:HK97 family phage prohead protease
MNALRVIRPGRLCGYVAVFNSAGVDEDDAPVIVQSGAFSPALRSGEPIVALISHNPRLQIASTEDGSLRLSQDDRGLHAMIDLTPNKHDWIGPLVGDGKRWAMSFAYDRESLECCMVGNVRIVTSVERLLDVGPCSVGTAGFKRTGVTWQPAWGGWRR